MMKIPKIIGRYVVFGRVDDMAAAKRELEAKGVKFLGDVFQYGSVRLAAFQDVSGNMLQVYQRVR